MPSLDKSSALQRQSERGNVFLFILLGVVLFGALTFTMSKGMRTEGTSKLSQKKASLNASDIIDRGIKLSNAVNILRGKGCGENQISFENPQQSGYTNTNAPTDKTCNVFDQSGGRLSWQDGWFITARNYVVDIPEPGNSTSDLIAVFKDIPAETCLAINKALNIATDLPTADDTWLDIKFQGNFNVGVNDLGDGWTPLAGKQAGCFNSAGKYAYYQLLISR